MKLWAKIWLITAFASVSIAYAAYPCLWDKAWYHLVSFAFVGFTRTIYLQSKGDWSLVAFVIWLNSLNALIDELFFNPKEMDYNEYIAFVLIIAITYKQRKKWIR